MDYKKESIKLHRLYKGKIRLSIKTKVENKQDLSLIYTPGVAEAVKLIAKNKNEALELTNKANQVAIVTDGSAILGLGDLGPEAALPVMEGKSVLFKKFADIDAIPICLNTKDSNEIIKTVKNISPIFSGINLEDISAPRCFEIEKRLQQELDIPVFHDDQHGTAIVILAGLINSLKLLKKKFKECKIVINGAGAAGIATSILLNEMSPKDIIVLDSKGIVSKKRIDLNFKKKEILKFTNQNNINGNLEDAIKKADIFIGVSKPNVLTLSMIKKMNDPIVFALANPDPEITYLEAKKSGVKIIATGRSDFPNQINNALVFPALFRGLLDNKIKRVTTRIKLNAAKALADSVKDLNKDKIIPSIFDNNYIKNIVESVK
nr:NADP-dependent malic enzyme [Candidatus Woesearchaeota archaeon]